MEIEILRQIALWLLMILAWIIFCAAFYFNISLFIATVRTKGVPYVGTMRGEIKVMDDHLRLEKGKKLLDLGCGDGKALRYLVLKHNLSKGVGYDLNHVATLWGRFLNRVKKVDNIQIIYDNFNKANIQEYDYIYMYLFPKHMEMNEEWIFSNLKKDAIVVVNTFQFPNRKPYKTLKNHKGKDRIYLYRA